MPSIVLASKSPRRRELLSTLTNDFTVVSSNFDENYNRPHDIFSVPKYLALQKALSVQDAYYDSIIIGSDTVVILDDMILEKPNDAAEAKLMLTKLSGTTHIVVTGMAILYEDTTISYDERAYVTFKNLDENIIDAYIATGDPFDKAGGYAIQNPDFQFVEKIEGEYETVVGFPLLRLQREIDKLITK